jgi:hypothetical protein
MVIPISEHGDGAGPTGPARGARAPRPRGGGGAPRGPPLRRSCARHGVFAESPKVNPLIP